jgi:copper chaperone CopZ
MEAGKNSGQVTLSISGMACDGCASTVKRILSRVVGVTRADVDFEARQACVEGTANAEDLVKAVRAAGYGAQPS